MKNNFVKIGGFLLIAVISLLLAWKNDYNGSPIVDYSFVTTTILELFSISLAIVAILFTVIDRYRDKIGDTPEFAQQTNLILKEISENTVALLICAIILIAYKILGLPDTICTFNIQNAVLIFFIVLALIIMIDTAISVTMLIQKLNNYQKNSSDNIELSENEFHLISACRKLDDKRINELLEYIKTLVIKQSLEHSQAQDSNKKVEFKGGLPMGNTAKAFYTIEDIYALPEGQRAELMR